MKKWNQFEAAKWFYERHNTAILGAPRNEWAIAPYEWDGLIQLTAIEYWLWGDIRDANAVFYPQYPVDRFFVDFANPVAKVVLECDGAAYHTDKAKDEARDMRLHELGWEVYRFPGWMCAKEPEEGELGEARQYLNAICEFHGLTRDRTPRGTDSYGMAVSVIEHIMKANEEPA